MKPLSVYKLSRAEAALRRLNAALDGLDAAVAERAAQSGEPVPSADLEELAALRARCAALEEVARATSVGLDETMSDLSRILEE